MIKRQDFTLAQEIKEEYLCGICYQIAINPMECIKCENLYCNDCAIEWTKKNNSCPNKCEGNFELKQAHRLIRAEISKIKCYCKYKQFGCELIIFLDNILSHIQKCNFMPVKCCQQCNWEGIQTQLFIHQEQCEYILDYTCKQCKFKVLKSQKDTHNCFEQLINKISQLELSFQDYKSQSEIKIQNLEKQVQDQKDIINSTIQTSSILLSQQQQQIKLLQNNESPQQSIILQQQQPIKPPVQPFVVQPSQSIRIQQQQQQIPRFKIDGRIGDSSKTKQCNKKHYLKFWQCPGIESSKQQCSICYKKQVCRYICDICGEYYCLICAPPEDMIKGKNSMSNCPQGHQMKNRANKNYICDVCGRSGELIPQTRTLNCEECDFDICQPCQDQMIKNKDCIIF